MGRTLAQRLMESGVVAQAQLIEAPSTGVVDVILNPGKTEADLRESTAMWEREAGGPDQYQPDIWRPFWIRNLDNLENELRASAQDKYSFRELRSFAEQIRDRLKQSPFVAQIDMVGVQDERVWLSYSGQRLNQFGIAPQTIVDRVHDRNINMPGGTVELPDQRVVVRPTGEYTSASEIGGTALTVSQGGYPLYLRDLVEVTRGYVDPPDVLNFRTLNPSDSRK
jgi:hypothetical protein